MRNENTTRRLVAEVASLKGQLEEAQETLRAIRSGEADALVVAGPNGDQIFTLKGAEQPYRILVETMNDGAVTLLPDGIIAYSNRRFAQMVQTPLEQVIGACFSNFLAPQQQAELAALLAPTKGAQHSDLTLMAAGGAAVPVQLSVSPMEIVESRGTCLIVRDMTEYRCAEQRLEHAGAYNRRLIEASLDPLVTIDAQGRIMDVNHATEEVTGHPRNELLGTDFCDYFTDPAKARVGYELVFKRGSVHDYELEIRHRDGLLTPVLYNASLYCDENGDVAGVFAAGRDISERKRAERTLREQAALLNLANDAIIVRKPHSPIVFWNRGAEDTYGWTSAEAVGRISHELLQTRFPVSWEAVEAALQERGKWEGELGHVTRDGRSIVVASRWSVLRDERGEPSALLEINRDITERKRAEEELRRAGAYHRRLIEASLDPLVTINAQGRIMDVNRATEEATGRPRNELLGTDFCDYFTDPGKARAGYERVFEQGTVYDYELEIRHRDGHLTPVLYNASLYRDEQGEIAGVFAAARDITERKRAESTLREQAALLNLAHDAILVRDPQDHIIFWTRGAEDTYGWPAGLAVGQVAQELLHTAFPASLETIHAVLHEQGLWEGELGHVTRDGRTIVVASRWSLQRGEHGEPKSILEIDRDITERKRAEEELRRAGAYNRRLIEASLDPLVTIDAQGRIMDVNRATEEATGRPRNELLGTDFCDYFTDPGKARAGYERVFEQGSVYDYELEVRHRDGHLTPVLYNASLYRDEQGEIAGVFAAARDITERKRQMEERRRAEAALQESEEAFRTLAEFVPQMVWICAPDGLNIYFNQRWVEYTGLTLEESYGRGWNTPFHPDDKQPAWNAWNQAVASGGTYRIECRLRRADGAYRWFLTKGVPLKDSTGRVVKWFGTCTDIDELKQVEEELRLSRQRLDLAQKAGHSGTFDWDILNNVNVWTPEMEALYGLAPGTFGGRYEDWEALVLPEDLPDARGCLEASLKTGEFAYEWRIRHNGDAEIRWIAGRAKVLFDEQGNPQRMIGINTDITERKRAEEEIRKLNEELEERVRRRTADLEAAIRELDSFCYTVSHDLRAPLRAISGFSAILLDEYVPHLPTEAQRLFDSVRNNAEQMGRLITDLLAFSRLGRQPLNTIEVAPAKVVRRALENLSSEQEGRRVEITVDDLPVCQADPSLLQQVFVNLLSNALKYTRSRETARIKVGATRAAELPAEAGGPPTDPEAIVYFVRDNGVGFDMRYSDKLFGVFQRLHSASEYEGTGVGLATVQRIIHRHGGKVWAAAAPDRGAAFYFTLSGPPGTALTPQPTGEQEAASPAAMELKS